MSSTRKTLNALDRSFLASERRDVMMHVGTLLQFSPPPGGAGDFGKRLREDLARDAPVESPWNLRLLHPDLLANPLQAWIEDDHFDLAYHVVRSLSATASDLDTPMFWSQPAAESPPRLHQDEATFDVLFRAVRDQLGATKDVGRAIVNLGRPGRGGRWGSRRP